MNTVGYLGLSFLYYSCVYIPFIQKTLLSATVV